MKKAPNNGKGRPKGAKNKQPAILKDAILRAGESAGGAEGLIGYLTKQATANPPAFMALLGKVLPLQIAGDPDNPLRTVTRIELVAPDSSS